MRKVEVKFFCICLVVRRAAHRSVRTGYHSRFCTNLLIIRRQVRQAVDVEASRGYDPPPIHSSIYCTVSRRTSSEVEFEIIVVNSCISFRTCLANEAFFRRASIEPVPLNPLSGHTFRLGNLFSSAERFCFEGVYDSESVFLR